MNNNIHISGYEDFFNELMSMVDGSEINNELGEAIKKHALSFIGRLEPKDFVRSGESYTRCYIGRDDASKWEAIIMCWKKGDQTAIHGHPNFASYNFLQGEVQVEYYSTANGDAAKKEGEFIGCAGDGFFAVGDADNFDNHIHRLTCLSDYAYSLHIYSNDARMGKVYVLAE